ncbi:MAG: GGDEF domain-containing protein [Bdellovibrionota bacterium]
MSSSNDSSNEKTTTLNMEQVQHEMQKAKGGAACLIIIKGTPQGQRYQLTKPEVTIGRDSTADLAINDSSISRKHALIKQSGANFTITDLGSSNGTFVNDNKVSGTMTVPLSKEDMVRLGTCILKFLPAGELESAMIGELEAKANTDTLTGAFNKGYLLDMIEAEFKRARGLRTPFSLLFFDLDHFKKINDNFGHDAGDTVLKDFSNLIRTKFVRPKDVFARYGGEEFVLLMNGLDAANAGLTAEKIRAAIEANHFIYSGKRLPVTTSLGVTEMKPEHTNGQDMLKSADKALYASKHGGRNRVSIATS